MQPLRFTCDSLIGTLTQASMCMYQGPLGKSSKMPFGRKLREQHFLYGEDFICASISHAQICPRSVVDAQIDEQIEYLGLPASQEAPRELYQEARQAFANELGCSAQNVVCVRDNLTALFTVARNMVSKGYLKWFFTTPHLVRILKEAGSEAGCEVDCSWLSNREYFTRDKLWNVRKDKKKKACLVLSTFNDLNVDWKEALEVAHHYELKVIVLSTIGMGAESFKVGKAKPDFFVTNASSWFLAGNSCSALYVSPEFQEGFFNDLGDGTKIYDSWHGSFENAEYIERSNLAAVVAAAQFRGNVLGGSKKVKNYQNSLGKKAHKYLVSAWGKSKLLEKYHSKIPAEFLIPCPFQPLKRQLQNFPQFLMEFCRERNIFVWCYISQSQVILHFSAACFLELNDFKTVRRVIDEGIQVWKEKWHDRAYIGSA